jgi:hypothetical protein
MLGQQHPRPKVWERAFEITMISLFVFLVYDKR